MQNIEIIKNWIAKFVIKLELCPFAHHPFSKGKIHFSAIDFTEQTKFMMHFWEEIERLESFSKEEISNSIIVISSGLTDFTDYLETINLCEGLLKMQELEDAFQIASFHPDYQFANIGKEHPRNFTNRSPLPLIHILRVEEVAAAIELYDNVEEIPNLNEKKMENIGREKLTAYLKSFTEK